MLLGEQLAATARTAALSTPAQLAAAVRELHEMLDAAGRDPATVDVQVQSPQSDPGGVSIEEHRHHLGELADAGATWFVVRTTGGGVDEACDALAAYGRDVIAGASNRRG